MATKKIQRVLIGELEIDATLSEQHSISVEVTDFPVEKGAAISDHKRVKPDVIKLEGVVSNTPLAPKDSLPANHETRAKSAFEYLQKLKNTDALIQIVTVLKKYENMTLVDAQMPQDARIGDVFQFTGTFKQVTIVENRTVAVVVTRAPNGKPLDKKGSQPTKEADESLERKSTAHRIKKGELRSDLTKMINPFTE